jgi:hypothetical protein
MNISDHISESLENIFGVKILQFFDADAHPYPGSGNLFDPGFGININKSCTNFFLDDIPKLAILSEIFVPILVPVRYLPALVVK